VNNPIHPLSLQIGLVSCFEFESSARNQLKKNNKKPSFLALSLSLSLANSNKHGPRPPRALAALEAIVAIDQSISRGLDDFIHVLLGLLVVVVVVVDWGGGYLRADFFN
jgi:hypothetical protein